MPASPSVFFGNMLLFFCTQSRVGLWVTRIVAAVDSSSFLIIRNNVGIIGAFRISLNYSAGVDLENVKTSNIFTFRGVLQSKSDRSFYYRISCFMDYFFLFEIHVLLMFEPST